VKFVFMMLVFSVAFLYTKWDGKCNISFMYVFCFKIGRTALHIAAGLGHLGFLRLLLRSDHSLLAMKDSHNRTAIAVARSSKKMRAMLFMNHEVTRDITPKFYV